MDDYVGGWWVGPRWVGLIIASWMMHLFFPEYRVWHDIDGRPHGGRDAIDADVMRTWVINGGTLADAHRLSEQSERYALTDRRDEARKLNMDKFGRSCCPCGYVEECATWCGNGHETGECESHRAEMDKITAKGEAERWEAKAKKFAIEAEHFAALAEAVQHKLVGTVQVQGYQNQNLYCSCGTHWPGPVAFKRHVTNSTEIWSEEH